MRFRQRIRQLQQQLSSLTAAIINSDLNLPTQPGTIHSTDASYRQRAGSLAHSLQCVYHNVMRWHFRVSWQQ